MNKAAPAAQQRQQRHTVVVKRAEAVQALLRKEFSSVVRLS